MAVDQVIVVGGSAGGIEALRLVLARVPRDVPAPVIIVVHLSPSERTILPQILSRSSALPVSLARSGEELRRGCAYVAPSDQHLLVRAETFHLSRGPRENHQRPAIDPLFRSAVRSFGSGVIGVVLSGALDDGATGLLAIREAGGLAVVQSPDDALFPSMPQAALAAVPDAEVVPAASMGEVLGELARAMAARRLGGDSRRRDEPLAAEEEGATGGDDGHGVPSAFVCPDCGGTLFLHPKGDLERYRCRVGHAYSLESLYAEKEEKLDEALWAALRVLKEHRDLSQRAADRMRKNGLEQAARSYDRAAHDNDERIASLKAALKITR